MPTTQTFALHDITIELTCPDRGSEARVHALWHQLFVLTPGVQQPNVRFHFETGESPPAAVGSPVYRAADLSVWRTEAGFYLRCGQSWLGLNLKEKIAAGYLHNSFWLCGLQDQREFFLLSLLMLLHRQRRFGLHANGLVSGEKGYLIVGASGQGKTTLTLAMIAQGWGYLGDDVVLLRGSAAGVMAQAFRRGFACTRETLNRFPVLQESMEDAASFGAEKWLLPPDSFYPNQFRACCLPQVLLFPSIVKRPFSRLAPLNQAQTLFYLTQQSAGLLTDTDIARRQIAVLSRLLQQVRPYRLEAGQDVFADATAVAELLARA